MVFNKKQKTIFLFSFVGVLAVIVIIVGILAKREKGDGKTGIEHNVGMSYVHTEIKNGAVSQFSADQVVPQKDVLIQNLEDQGYTVETKENVFDSDITAEQINAVKGDEFCSITYGLSQKGAKEVFTLYEQNYPKEECYILARNECYVYCLSSNKAFKAAKFQEIATDGELYLNHDNY